MFGCPACLMFKTLVASHFYVLSFIKSYEKILTLTLKLTSYMSFKRFSDALAQMWSVFVFYWPFWLLNLRTAKNCCLKLRSVFDCFLFQYKIIITEIFFCAIVLLYYYLITANTEKHIEFILQWSKYTLIRISC